MRALELGADDRGVGVKGDEFWRTLKGVEAGLLERDAERSKKRKVPEGAEGEDGKEGKEAKKTGDGIIDMAIIKEDLSKAYPLVYWAFKVRHLPDTR